MRLFLLTALTMLAFAANSILNRMALAAGDIDAMGFAVIRVAAGAAVLVLLAIVQRRRLPLVAPGRAAGVMSLCLYLIGFSVAYLRLDAGLGALILFGCVQITMFAGAVIAGETVPRARWIGAGVALIGLAWLVWPAGAVQVPLLGTLFMALAGAGWGVYSLAGRKSGDPLAATAANFLLAVPVCGAAALLLPGAAEPPAITPRGVVLAGLSGAVTSGLGYALWYSVLPRLDSAVAGLVQLTVPVIAILGGIALLGEGVSLRLAAAGAVVLGGIAYGLLAPQRRIGSSGS
ncbi:DMT family transporter [Rhodobacteraceae bacterium W635]|uniref:DMT family transporter n=1 Tax=Nioella halotolerans TaxID=2303578 RepID=UPI000E3B765A|nr:DMT family transporter [Rhodobacteraceae bacterium W635]